MKNFFRFLLILVTTTASQHSIGFSQCLPLYTFSGPHGLSFYGISVSSAGDINNDGIDDIIIGSLEDVGAEVLMGAAFVLSGQNGDTLFAFYGKLGAGEFGESVSATGDINKDGYNDFVVGAPGNFGSGVSAGQVFVFSGQTGDTLYAFEGEVINDYFGNSVTSAGDYDNDGFADILVGAYGHDGSGVDAGRAYVFSGQTGDTLFVFNGKGSDDWFGFSVSSLGDVNNDGFDDIIIGAPYNEITGVEAGCAYVFSGQTGDTLFVFSGEAAGDLMGISVSSAGDVNNDGYDDIIVGASRNDGNGVNAGRAYVFSGQTGDTLFVLSGQYAGDGFGYAVSSAGDVNNDLFVDILVGSPGSDAQGPSVGRAYVYSGQTGDILLLVSGKYSVENLGSAVSATGDLNSDGYSDIIVGAQGGGQFIQVGQAHIYSTITCFGTRGDINGDGIDANVLDLTHLVDYIFRHGLRPVCYEEADVNSDGSRGNILDLTFLVDRIFRGGPAPGPC